MEFISLPANYTSAFEESIYVIGAEEDELVVVDIYDRTDQLIGQKSFKGSTRHTLNISPYSQAQLEVAPVQSDECAFHAQIARTSYLSVGLGEATSTYTIQTGAIEPFVRYRALTKSPDSRVISTSARDELSFYCGAYALKAYLTLHQGSDSVQMLIASATATQEGVYALVLDMEDLQSKLDGEVLGSILDYDRFEVSINVGGDPIFTRTYRAVEATSDDVMLCWWNTLGGIDYYTFQAKGEQQLLCEKSRIYTHQGYRTLSSEAVRQSELFSPFLNKSSCEWLAEIIASPRVWRVEGASYTPVEILNTSATVRSEQLTRLELRIAPSLKTCYLTY